MGVLPDFIPHKIYGVSLGDIRKYNNLLNNPNNPIKTKIAKSKNVALPIKVLLFKNSLEPFRRIGENTVLFTLDRHENDCKYNFNRKGGDKSYETLKPNNNQRV